MPIIKIQVKKRTHPYVMIDKRPLDDPRLSWAARGLLAHLLCRPPPWRLVFANLLRQSPDGRYVLKRLLNELREFGYAKIKRLRDAMGKMAGSTWFIYEDPELFGDTEKLVCPLSVKSDPRQNLALGKVRQSDESETINNEYSNNPTNNNKTSKRLLAPDGEWDLLDQIREILGEAEMKKNGGMWRTRIRGGESHRRALRNTIEDYKIRTPDQRQQIRNLPRWFTDRYVRNLVKISPAARTEPCTESMDSGNKCHLGFSRDA